MINSPRRDEVIAALRSALAGLSGTDTELAQRVEADLGFHLLLCQLTGNPMLVESWKHLRAGSG